MIYITAALLSAFLLYIASPGPGFYFCSWFALVPLFWSCRQTEPGRSFRLGFVSGMFYYTFLLRWVTISLENYGYLPWWISWPALLLLAAYMSLYLGLFAWIFSTCLKRVRQIWAAPVIWTALDYLRSFLFSGFPWQDLGYSQYSNVFLIQSADLAGHYGITFLIVLANTILFSLLSSVRNRPSGLKINTPYPLHQIISALLLLAAALYYSDKQNHHYIAAEGQSSISTAVIQGSIKQEEKWRSGSARQTIEKYLHLSRRAAEGEKPELLIWPETAIPFLGFDHPLMIKIRESTVNEGNYPLLTGMPYYVRNKDSINYYNSALLLKPDGSRVLYHKRHLVPFGEYIPYGDRLDLPGPLVQSIGNFSAGQSSTPLKSGRAELGVLICFESIFPELARKTVNDGANLLVNITNDAWFGYSNATVQHMAMAVFRAVENRRSLARAANTGISCFVMPSGRIEKATPLFRPLFIKENLPLLQQKTIYSRYGWVFPQLCLLAAGIIIILLVKRKR